MHALSAIRFLHQLKIQARNGQFILHAEITLTWFVKRIDAKSKGGPFSIKHGKWSHMTGTSQERRSLTTGYDE